jgi:NADH-quinone oxidoreductase subunit N
VTAADAMLTTPWLLLGAGLLVVLVLCAFVRHQAVIAVVSSGLQVLVAAVALRLALGGAVAGEASLALVALDGVAFLLCALFAGTGAIVSQLAGPYLAGRDDDPLEFHVLLLCAVFGAMTLAAADHAATLVLGLEILSVPLYAMIAYTQRSERPVEAGVKYLVLSGVASTTLLLGVAFLYARTGSLAFDAFAGAGRVPADDPVVLAGSVLVLAAIAFKLSLAPFHMWTPDVYQGAPAPAGAVLATIAKAAVVVVLLRIVLAADTPAGGAVGPVLAGLAVLSMLVGNVLALLQRSLKRLLAYSSVAHMGYAMIALVAIAGGTGAGLGVEATLAYLIAYTVTTLTAFAVIIVLAPRDAPDDPDEESVLTGLFWERPFTACVLTIALLSLAGIPLTAGFLGKFYVVAAGVEHGAWILLGALLVGSGIGLFYYLRILYALVSRSDPNGSDPGGPAPEPPRLAPRAAAPRWLLGALAGATVVLGTWPAWLVDLVGIALAP